MTVSEAIAEWLHAKNIAVAFGIIGGGNHVLFDAISKKGKTEIVCCHHEQAAVMASAYYNRIAKRIGSVALVTTGAGSTNAITGVMAAFMDSIPLLVLSGNEASKYMYSEDRVWGVQGYDSSGLVEKCTKLAFRLEDKMGVNALNAAYQMALYEPPGPCWVDIPKDVQSAHV